MLSILYLKVVKIFDDLYHSCLLCVYDVINTINTTKPLLKDVSKRVMVEKMNTFLLGKEHCSFFCYEFICYSKLKKFNTKNL